MEDVKIRIIERAMMEGLIKTPSDLQIADDRGFTKKAFELSRIFKSHYQNLESLSDAQIIRIFRYFMGKAAETCIANELYGSDEKRICNINYLFCDVDNEYFHINIPGHYMFELSDLSLHYLMPLKEDVEYMRSEKDFKGSLSTALIYWQVVAYAHAHLWKAYTAHGKYDNNSIKTLDEVRIVALRGVLQNLSSNGWKIEKMNYLLSNPWNIIAQYDGNDYLLLLRTNYGFFNTGITIEEMRELADFAKKSTDKSYSIGYILVDINAANEQHKEDHVIIIGDQMKYEIKEFPLFRKEGIS